MKHRLTAKLKSQRGASLSVALLLFLVCVALSSVVIAAATASSGRFADQGEADQRYYAVTSATRLFLSSMDNSVREYTVHQSMIGTMTVNFNDSSSEEAISISSTDGAIAQLQKPSNTKGYDFLSVATFYIFSGVERDLSYSDINSQMEDMLKKQTGAPAGPAGSTASIQFMEPFKWGNWQPSTEEKDLTYTLTPSIQGSDDAVVVVSGKLMTPGGGRDSAVLKLDFHNQTAAGNDEDQYHVYVELEANIIEDETIQSLSTESATANGYTQTVLQTKMATVEWSLSRLEPGNSKGLN